MSRAGKRALVTGGSAGLGLAFCRELVDQGYRVINVDRDELNQETSVETLLCDLTDDRQVGALIDQLGERGPFDLVILNAGISATGKFEQMPPEAYRRLLAVNTRTPMILCTSLASGDMLAPDARIVFISSLSHYTGYPGAAVYAASKDAIAVYAKSLIKPFKRHLGVSVTCAFPGPIRTDHAARHAPANADASKRIEPQSAAQQILIDAMAGKQRSLPGSTAGLAAFLGRVLPVPMTYMMRKVIFEKLDRNVW